MDRRSETPKETDDTNDADDVPMSETPVNDGRNASHIKSKSSAADTDGVRQRLKFDGEASGMTPDPKKSKETVKQGEIRESNALLGESLDKKKVRFSSESGDYGACACTVEELVEDCWSDEHGQGGGCLRDSIARWNQIWIRQPLRLRWIACWKTELCAIFREVKVLA